jgi:hypothetical protein
MCGCWRFAVVWISARLGLEDLERDLAVVLLVPRQVDGRHAPLTELALDHVAAREGGVQAGDGVGHARNM